MQARTRTHAHNSHTYARTQVDVRSPDTQPAKWQLSADVESVLWSPHDPTHFLVSCEDGLVAVFDARKGAGACVYSVLCVCVCLSVCVFVCVYKTLCWPV
jgi:hypothetical protein